MSLGFLVATSLACDLCCFFFDFLGDVAETGAAESCESDPEAGFGVEEEDTALPSLSLSASPVLMTLPDPSESATTPMTLLVRRGEGSLLLSFDDSCGLAEGAGTWEVDGEEDVSLSVDTVNIQKTW